jgi:hypothetical protein
VRILFNRDLAAAEMNESGFASCVFFLTAALPVISNPRFRLLPRKTIRCSAPKQAVDFEIPAVLLKRYPDTKPEGNIFGGINADARRFSWFGNYGTVDGR